MPEGPLALARGGVKSVWVDVFGGVEIAICLFEYQTKTLRFLFSVVAAGAVTGLGLNGPAAWVVCCCPSSCLLSAEFGYLALAFSF